MFYSVKGASHKLCRGRYRVWMSNFVLSKLVSSRKTCDRDKLAQRLLVCMESAESGGGAGKERGKRKAGTFNSKSNSRTCNSSCNNNNINFASTNITQPFLTHSRIAANDLINSFNFLTQSLGLRKVLANKDILEPIVEQTISIVHEEEFNSLAKELGFLKESCNDDKTERITPPKVIF